MQDAIRGNRPPLPGIVAPGGEVAEHEALARSEPPFDDLIRAGPMQDVAPDEDLLHRRRHVLRHGLIAVFERKRRVGGRRITPGTHQLPRGGSTAEKTVASFRISWQGGNRRPGRGHEPAVEPARDEHEPAGALRPESHGPIPHGKPQAGAVCGHANDRRKPDIAHGQEHPPLLGRERRVIERQLRDDEPNRAIATPLLLGRHWRGDFREDAGRREDDVAVDCKIAVGNRQPLSRQTCDPLDPDRPVRGPHDEPVKPPRRPQRIEEREGGGSHDVAGKKTGGHREAFDLPTQWPREHYGQGAEGDEESEEGKNGATQSSSTKARSASKIHSLRLSTAV